MTQDNKLSLHWSQWVCPGPRRKFSTDEMARAGQQPWPKAIDGYVMGNVAVLLAINYLEMSRHWALAICLGVLAASYAVLAVARVLWRAPTRLNLNLSTLALALASIGLILLFKFWPPLQLDQKARLVTSTALLGGMVMVSLAWWFLIILRVQQIEARLRELDEQAHSVQLARRLATAQIQPHFLFNTLASVQHWVDTQDARAGSTLRAFTAYLRATLPMFEREALSLDEELQIVRNYLLVMQARLGSRLSWTIEADPALAPLQLPPGLLLTLVENAIGHGIEPSLRGGSIAVRALQAGDWLRLEVQDDGVGLSCAEEAGPAAQACGANAGAGTGGVGLNNARARLAQLHGAAARLSLQAQAPGCLALVEIPKPKEHA